MAAVFVAHSRTYVPVYLNEVELDGSGEDPDLTLDLLPLSSRSPAYTRQQRFLDQGGNYVQQTVINGALGWQGIL